MKSEVGPQLDCQPHEQLRQRARVKGQLALLLVAARLDALPCRMCRWEPSGQSPQASALQSQGLDLAAGASCWPFAQPAVESLGQGDHVVLCCWAHAHVRVRERAVHTV